VKRRGLSLMGTMWLVTTLSVLIGCGILTLESIQGRLTGHKQQQQAACLALSGQNYAQALKRWGKWDRFEHFRSPEFPGAGYFEVRKVAGGRYLSVGYSGRSRCELAGAP